MKLIWHIIRKDVIRDRRALLLWAALFVAQVGIGLVLLRDVGNDRDFLAKMRIANASLVFSQFLAGYVLVVRLVHADSLFGTEMFWATRPISRGRLFAAKAGAAVLIFGLLPVLLYAPWWLWCGFTPRDLFWAAVETFGWQLLMIAPAFLVATLTNELARALMWTVLLIIGGMFWIAAIAAVARPMVTVTLRMAPDQAATVYNSVLYTRLWLSAALAVVLSGAIAGHHYLTGRLTRSIALAIVGTGLVVATGMFAPWDWHRAFLDLPRPAATPEITRALSAVQAKPGFSAPSEPWQKQLRRGILEPALHTEIYFDGLPAETTVSTGNSRFIWRWPDGTEIKRFSYIRGGYLPSVSVLRRKFSLAEPVEDAETAEHYRELRAGLHARLIAKGHSPGRRMSPIPPSQSGQRVMIDTPVPLALAERGLAEAPAFEADLECTLSRASFLTELPLQAGAQGGRDSTWVRFQWLSEFIKEPENKGRIAWLLVTAPVQKLSGLWAINALVRDWAIPGRGEVWIVNHRDGHYFKTANYSLLSTRTALIGGVALSWNQPHLSSFKIWRENKFLDRDSEWVEHSSLIFIQEEILARFSITAKTDQQAFKPSLYAEDTDPGSLSH